MINTQLLLQKGSLKDSCIHVYCKFQLYASCRTLGNAVDCNCSGLRVLNTLHPSMEDSHEPLHANGSGKIGREGGVTTVRDPQMRVARFRRRIMARVILETDGPNGAKWHRLNRANQIYWIAKT